MNTGLAVDRHRPPLALLIDRDADTRQMYAEFLGQSCAIDEAVDGREALAKALSRHPDIIITETRLPGINGYELCRILRLDSQTRDIPIVVVTGDAFDLDLQRAKNAGADAVLTKPCVPEQLATEIRRLLRQAAQLRERAKGARAQLGAEVARSAALLGRPAATPRRVMLSRAHERYTTTTPPAEPPALVCPVCDRPLQYTQSHVGGVNRRHQEQWDYYECSGGCGTFQYRQRTRKLHRAL